MLGLLLLPACDQDWGRPSTTPEEPAWITAPVVSIQPQAPGSAADLLALVLVPGESSESASPELTLRWSVDGEPVPELDDAAAVPASFTSVGETWSLSVTARAGELVSDEVLDDVQIANEGPEISLTLSPEQPTTSDTLDATVELADPDGEQLEVMYTWFRDGVEVEDSDSSSVDPDQTTRDEQWLCRAATVDGSQARAEAWAGVGISNTPPTFGAAVITPQPLTAETEATCIGLGEDDADDDELSTEIVWTIDGVAAAEGEILAAGSVVRAQLVSCELTVSDDQGVGETVASDEVEVANTAPTAPTVWIDPTNPREGTTLIAMIDTASVDADGDAITYTVAWTVDGAAYGTGTEVPGEDVHTGQQWTLTVTPSDGVDSGTGGTSTAWVY
ncbi:MAG TPA: hypothetical protein QGF58_20575 [Myxococcota bacterium]|nr:hypothetical protein [Myxococcota bacterium]